MDNRADYDLDDAQGDAVVTAQNVVERTLGGGVGDRAILRSPAHTPVRSGVNP